MKIKIDEAVLRDYPEARIGWLVADISAVPEESRYVDMMKYRLEDKLKDIGMTEDTLLLHPDVMRWRNVFSRMGVKPSKYNSSLEALLRRIFKGELWSVSTVVDCYDSVSAMNLLPMGAFDMGHIAGDLTLRYGKEGESFLPLGAEGEPVKVSEKHIVYADGEKVCCWLWNHRDSREAGLSGDTKKALFMIDCAFETEWRSVKEGLAALKAELGKVDAVILSEGICDEKAPECEL